MKKLFHSFFLCILFLVAFRCGALYADCRYSSAESPAVQTAEFRYDEQNADKPTLEEDLRQAADWQTAEAYIREKLPLTREAMKNCFSANRESVEKVCSEISGSLLWLWAKVKETGAEIQNEFVKKQACFLDTYCDIIEKKKGGEWVASSVTWP